jgi:hypothetical protein
MVYMEGYYSILRFQGGCMDSLTVRVYDISERLIAMSVCQFACYHLVCAALCSTDFGVSLLVM